MSVSLSSLRNAASQLRSGGYEVNCAALARSVGKNRRTLSDFLNVYNPHFKQALGVERGRGAAQPQAQHYSVYETAALAIREEGLLPCPSNLAARVGFSRKLVHRHLREYSDLAKRLCLYTEHEAQMWCAARVILSRGEQVTRLGLATEMNCAYQTVQKALKSRPSLVRHLALCRAPRCSGVGKRVHTK